MAPTMHLAPQVRSELLKGHRLGLSKPRARGLMRVLIDGSRCAWLVVEAKSVRRCRSSHAIVHIFVFFKSVFGSNPRFMLDSLCCSCCLDVSSLLWCCVVARSRAWWRVHVCALIAALPHVCTCACMITLARFVLVYFLLLCLCVFSSVHSSMCFMRRLVSALMCVG